MVSGEFGGGGGGIGIAIATLLNRMSELDALANKFDLKEELYYGGCFEKILNLLGSTRERKFISKHKNADARGMGKVGSISRKRVRHAREINYFE